jgi:YVTN family beta-propeller protein
LKRVFSILLIAISLSACVVARSHVRPPLEHEGSITLYLQPLSQEAGRLSFTLARIAAVRDDGQEFPLDLQLSELKGAEIKRQRLLCEGVLPQGSYVGFSVTALKATLKSPEGESDLLLAESPTMVKVAFKVAARKASVMFTAFNYRQSVISESSFKPAFAIAPPPPVVTAVSGYASIFNTNTITIFDKNAMVADGAIATRRGPKGLVIDQKLQRVYAAIPDEALVEVIDMTTQQIMNTIRLFLGDTPQGLALTPDGRTLLSVNTGSNSVSFLDTTSFIEISRITVGIGPNALIIDSMGRRAYVFNTFSNTISVIDVPRRALITSFSTDSSPLWGQFNAKGDRLYIIFGSSTYMSVLDTTSLTVLNRVYVGFGVNSLKVDPVTDLIYLGKISETQVSVYDPFSLKPFDYISVREAPAYITIDGEENKLWIAGITTGRLVSVDLVSRKVVAEIDVSSEPFWLTMMGER